MPFEEQTIGPCRLIRADCLDAASLIVPGSVAAVVTDPPYPKQYQDCFEKLAEFATQTLVDGGHLVTLLGHYQLPFVLDVLRQRLKYRWICSLRNAEGITPIMHGFRVKVNWKPALWFTKGKANRHAIMDDELFRAGKAWSKHLHEWAQPVVFGPIVKLAEKGAVVADPFMGSGTNGVACIQTGRRFIGCEVDAARYETACRRIRRAWQDKCSELPFEKPPTEVQKPLFTET